MFNPVQAQSFLVYGSGVVIGNTSVTLASFLDINGVQLQMSNFGTVGTFTIEPNAGAQEEQCIFTGVIVNSNGTTTLTGISSVGFESPYTQTSGFAKSHAGLTTVVLSDTAYLYSQYANLQNTQTFTGSNTFNIAPFIPTVASSAITQAASVGYVNAISIAGAPKASNTVFGITELSVAPVTASVPIAVGQNDPAMPTPSEALALVGDGGVASNLNTYVTQQGLQNGSEFYALTTGSSTTYAIAFSPTPSGYVTGEIIKFKTHLASGTSPTINKNSLGAKNLYKQISTGTTPLSVGDMGTNQVNMAEYDGGAYQLLNPTANIPTFLGKFFNTITTHDVSVTGTQTIVHGLGIIPKLLKITALGIGTNPYQVSIGTYNGTTTATNFSIQSAGNSTNTTDTTNIILFQNGGGNNAQATGSFDATNITLTWSKTGTPTGTINLLVEAYA